jgi:hypothetical protein
VHRTEAKWMHGEVTADQKLPVWMSHCEARREELVNGCALGSEW